MTHTRLTLAIDAPLERVFDTVAHIESFSKASPHIVDVDFLSERRRGVGTRFRETRMVGKRRASTELEVTEYVLNERVRFVSDAGGTVWDSLFELRRVDGKTVLDFTMDARAYKLFAKALNPLMRGMVAKFIARDMDSVKAYCEGVAR
jgi:hypothetical protein